MLPFLPLRLLSPLHCHRRLYRCFPLYQQSCLLFLHQLYNPQNLQAFVHHLPLGHAFDVHL
ncbi:hypothetical protein AHAS_Ahas20G0190000 [Arachis hypogaea]